MIFWKRKTIRTENRSEVVSLKEEKEGTTLGFKRVWGVLGLFYFLLVVVVTSLHAFVKTQNWTVKRINNLI